MNAILVFFITSVFVVDAPQWIAKGVFEFEHPYFTLLLVAYHAIGFFVLYNRIDLTKIDVSNGWFKCLALIVGWPVFKEVVKVRNGR